MKAVQIPTDLWEAIVEYHTRRDLSDRELQGLGVRIRCGIAEKQAALERRTLYGKSRTAATPEAREAARQEYLDAAGIMPDWRWSEGYDPKTGE